EDMVPVTCKRKKKRCLSSSLNSDDEHDIGPSSPHSRLNIRLFKWTVPPKAKRVFSLFKVSKQFSHNRDKSCLSAISPSPSSSRAFAHSSSVSQSCSRQGSPEIDWESEEVVCSAASTERGKLSNIQMARMSLLGKVFPSKLFHSRWAIEQDSEVRDFAKLAFRSLLVKEDDPLLRNHIGIPDILALMAPEIDPALLSII
ncbi:Hypothetical predicted protein, partial [Pelobates cultripes]